MGIVAIGITLTNASISTVNVKLGSLIAGNLRSRRDRLFLRRMSARGA
jgi:hypothetical protein